MELRHLQSDDGHVDPVSLLREIAGEDLRTDSALCHGCRGRLELVAERTRSLHLAREELRAAWDGGREKRRRASEMCEVCGRVFSLRRYLRDHLRRAHDAALHDCADCGRQFRRRMQLERHRARGCGTGEGEEDEQVRKTRMFVSVAAVVAAGIVVPVSVAACIVIAVSVAAVLVVTAAVEKDAILALLIIY